MKVFIAVPCMDQLPARFAQSLAMLKRHEDTVVSFEIGSLVYFSRNNLAKAAIKHEADWVLWLDSDMTFPPDFLVRMIRICEEKGLDFLSGLYFRRNPPYATVLYDRLEATDHGASFTTFEFVPDELFEIGGCGFGGVLMRTEVLMDVMGKFHRIFDPIDGMGEDLSFCWRARQCGYHLWCDPTLEMGHVGYAEITRGYFEAYRRGNDDAGTSKAGDEDLDERV